MFDSPDYAALVPVRDRGFTEMNILLTQSMESTSADGGAPPSTPIVMGPSPSSATATNRAEVIQDSDELPPSARRLISSIILRLMTKEITSIGNRPNVRRLFQSEE